MPLVPVLENYTPGMRDELSKAPTVVRQKDGAQMYDDGCRTGFHSLLV